MVYLLSLASVLGLALVVEYFVSPDRIRAATVQNGRLSRFMSERFESVRAYDDRIEYSGRWLSIPGRSIQDQFCKVAAFGGSGLEFSVFNTTSVNLQLANAPYGAEVDDSKPGKSSPPVLTPASSTTSRTEGPVSFFHSVNGSDNTVYHHNVDSIVTLVPKLDPNAIHTFRVTLPHSSRANTIQFRNVWIDKGGQLLHPRARDEVVHTTNNNTAKKTTMLRDKGAVDIPKRRLIEIMAPATLVGHTCPSIGILDPSPSAANWPTMLRDNFHETEVSTLGIPVEAPTCLTSRCKIALKPQRLFFRSGPLATALYNDLWPFTDTSSTPTALILILGLPDVEALLSTDQPGKHSLTSFIEEFSHEYSIFVQTIRRAAYSPSSLANQNARFKQAPLDESHLYSSAPSTLLIFLVLPPIPSSLLIPNSHQLKSLLHHATTKVPDHLKLHIGDRRTIVIDTDGWLSDSDFTPCQHRDPDGEHELQLSASDFALTQSGHIKFAHHLSLHLCAYLGRDQCPFERHGEHVGNLVVPEIEEVGRKMEEKRVEKVKEIFGII